LKKTLIIIALLSISIKSEVYTNYSLDIEDKKTNWIKNFLTNAKIKVNAMPLLTTSTA
jgi:hypothetical protein